MGKAYSPDELMQEFITYKEYNEDKTKEDGVIRPLSFAGLALWCHITEQTIRNYKHDPAYTEVIERISLYIEEFWNIFGANTNRYKFAEFQLTNKYGHKYANKSVVETVKSEGLSIEEKEQKMQLLMENIKKSPELMERFATLLENKQQK